MTWAAHFTSLGEKRDGYKFLVRKSAGKKPRIRISFRWEANIKMDVEGIGFEGVDRCWDVMNAVINL